jgi:hypothetical protein
VTLYRPDWPNIGPPRANSLLCPRLALPASGGS